MVTMGRAVIINASNDIMQYVQKQFTGRMRDEILYLPFFYDICSYYLPDVEKITQLIKPDGFYYEMVEKQSIADIHKLKGFDNAIKYHPHPVELVFVAKYKDKIIGIAGASADCKMMWSIGVDVLSPYRGEGIATALVNMLTLEILNRGYIPYYYAVGSNTASQRVAIKAGYVAVWAHTYKAKLKPDSILDKIKTLFK